MKVEVGNVIDTLMHGNQLKRTIRTGWAQRGVANAEDVAAHSFGVAFTALILAELIDEQLDKGKMLAMAILHDLPESLTSDIPTPSWRYLPEGSKRMTEDAAMNEILAHTGYKSTLLELWHELQEAETVEARVVNDADKLDMYLQAVVYEEQTGNQHLEEFWSDPKIFNFPLFQQIYEALRKRREKIPGASTAAT